MPALGDASADPAWTQALAEARNMLSEGGCEAKTRILRRGNVHIGKERSDAS